MGGIAQPRLGDQGAHALASGGLSRGVRSRGQEQRRASALGARRQRAQPDRLRHSLGAWRQDVGQEQIDADRRMRHAPFLETRDINVIETDLGERIQQLDNEPPSHIVVPAVHKLRGDVSEVFARTIGSEPGNNDVHYLAEAMRRNTRPYFLNAEAGMTGANFAIAETGSFVVCTNEGNADLSANVPKLHIASIGIEKIIPKIEHLAVFIRMLSRSALGSPITQYTSHFRAPRPGTELHIVLVDNGRSQRLGHEGLLVFAQVHPLRRVHEHLPGLPPQRRPELRSDLLRSDRHYHRSRFRYPQIQQSPLRLDAQRQLHQCLPGQDQHPRADLQVATGHGRAQSAAARQEGGDPHHWQGDERAPPLSRSDIGDGTRNRAPAALRYL